VAGFAEGFEGFQDFFDALDAAVGGAAEGPGDILGGGAGGKLGERVVDGAGLSRRGAWARVVWRAWRA
jgi:hypothetical protein